MTLISRVGRNGLSPVPSKGKMSTRVQLRTGPAHDTSTGENEEDGGDGGGSGKEGEAAKDFGHYVQDELMDFDRIEVEKECFTREEYYYKDGM